MNTYTKKELNDILAKHKLWLKTGTQEGERANFCGANLSGANLRCADLCGADLCGADLSRADLCFIKCYYTRGDIIYIGGQGAEQRYITLVKKTRMAFIGCFKGTFDEARAAIREKYGDKATVIDGGYGLTLMAMDAIERVENS